MNPVQEGPNLMFVANASEKPAQKPRFTRIFSSLALASYFYILYHLPPGAVWRVAVAGSCCVGLVTASRDLFGDSRDSFFSEQTKDRVIRPTISDIEDELDQAWERHETVNALLIAFRGAWSLAAALTLYLIMRIRKLSGLG